MKPKKNKYSCDDCKYLIRDISVDHFECGCPTVIPMDEDMQEARGVCTQFEARWGRVFVCSSGHKSLAKQIHNVYQTCGICKELVVDKDLRNIKRTKKRILGNKSNKYQQKYLSSEKLPKLKRE